METIYLTTTLPYVNSDPHIGHALEIVQADAVARFYRSLGREVFFNTGTDEHGLKIYRKAIESGQDPQVYVDGFAEKFDSLKDALNLSYDNFIRTTDSHHVKAAQEFWRRCLQKGDIYKKSYKSKYCVGCELEKTDSDLVDGHCPIHPSQELEVIEEENYFFRFSKYQNELLSLYKSNPDFILPSSRLNEIRSFVERGLEDFSISRLKDKMPWGVPVPDDPGQVMYVWFDALVNYVSAIGWPEDMSRFDRWWPVVQFAGKDNLRQQAAIWQAMLLSAGLPLSKKILIHGFITSNGQKMSKSEGNVIGPFEIVRDYGTDALRYYLLRHITPFEDSDFTLEKFKESFNAHLANGLGNVTSRIMTMAQSHLDEPVKVADDVSFSDDFVKAMESFEFNEAMDIVWRKIGELDEKIAHEKPYTLVKEDKERAIEIIKDLTERLYTIGLMLDPLLPETSAKLRSIVKSNTKPIEPLFLRKE